MKSMKKLAVFLTSLSLVLALAAAPPGPAAAEPVIVRYPIGNADLSRGLEGWDTGDASKFAKGSQIDIVGMAGTPRSVWFRAHDAARTGGGVLYDDAAEIWIELHNETDAPVRIRSVAVSAEREESAAKYDVDRDGAIGLEDEQALVRMIRQGKRDALFDYDQDGELTAKDVSYLRKFGLKRADEVYLNLKHFNFMNEKIEIGGVPMFITHLYAEPVDRSDPSKGYEWVGDPQEGVAAVDDVSRAVIVYAEHYRAFQDSHSYDMIKRGLEFLMWMQHEDGDFDNFVVREPDGTIHPKDSHSSQKSFGWWAVRAYEAMGTALPLLDRKDKALAARVAVRLSLSLKRLKEKTDPHYGEWVTGADGGPVPGRKVTVTAGGATGIAIASAHGEFALRLSPPRSRLSGGIRITASTSLGEGTAWIHPSADESGPKSVVNY